MECLSDLFESGVKDDKLALLYNVNKNVKITVKTPVGRTNRSAIYNVILQGDVFGHILCSNQIDIFGRECFKEGNLTLCHTGRGS